MPYKCPSQHFYFCPPPWQNFWHPLVCAVCQERFLAMLVGNPIPPQFFWDPLFGLTLGLLEIHHLLFLVASSNRITKKEKKPFIRPSPLSPQRIVPIAESHLSALEMRTEQWSFQVWGLVGESQCKTPQLTERTWWSRVSGGWGKILQRSEL